MPIRVVTWNLFYGTCGSQPQFNGGSTSAVERLNAIAGYANLNNIDAVFLQEHPSPTSQQTDNQGLLIGHNTQGYAYHVFREMSSFYPSNVSSIIRSYAVLTKPGVVLGNMSYYNQASFRQYNGGPYMRAPILTPITVGVTNYNFLHWHNQVGNDAQTGFNILTQILIHAMPQNVVIIGDLNVTSNFVNNHNFYANWDDVVNNNFQNGVDHVLSPYNAYPAYNLDFMSDPNHYPIDCVLT